MDKSDEKLREEYLRLRAIADIPAPECPFQEYDIDALKTLSDGTCGSWEVNVYRDDNEGETFISLVDGHGEVLMRWSYSRGDCIPNMHVLAGICTMRNILSQIVALAESVRQYSADRAALEGDAIETPDKGGAS